MSRRPSDIAAEARAELQRCLRILGPLPKLTGSRGTARAWDAPIRAALAAPGAPIEARRAWNHAIALWWELALCNTTRIVRAEAWKHLYAGANRYTVDDLEAAAILGVFRAAQGWDGAKGASWKTFAGSGARMGIQLHLRQGQTEYVKINERYRQQLWAIRRWRNALEAEGLPARTDTLAELTGVESCVAQALTQAGAIVHLDAPFRHSDGEASDRHEMIGPSVAPSVEEEVERAETIARVRRALGTLSEREQQVLEGRMAEQTLGQIGDRFGLSRERVRQIEQRALQRLAVELGAEAGPIRRLTLSDRVRAGLRNAPATVPELAERLGAEPAAVRRALEGSAVRVGTRAGRHVWALREAIA